MFLILKTLNSLISLLNSEKSPNQLAAGISFGVIMGFSPFLSLHNLILFFLVCLLRVNLSMFFLSLGLFSIVGFILDPVFDGVGYWALVDLKWARPLWIEISTGSIWPFFRFNNTIVMGSLILGLFVALLGFPFFRQVIISYRTRWRENIKNSKFIKALKATPLYGLYEKYQSFREKMSIIS